MTSWPQTGHCGACGRPARRFPSGNWEHDVRPCRARSQSLWRIDDTVIASATRFVPAGQPLPTLPDAIRARLAPDAQEVTA